MLASPMRAPPPHGGCGGKTGLFGGASVGPRNQPASARSFAQAAEKSILTPRSPVTRTAGPSATVHSPGMTRSGVVLRGATQAEASEDDPLMRIEVRRQRD